MTAVWQGSIFIVVGLLVALALARHLDALSLGDDTGTALGAKAGRTRVVGMVAVTLLCGAATAVAGPIAFVGLAVPHLVRAATGPNHRWLLPYCVVFSPVLLLGADVLGRVVGPGGELEVSIMTAVLGGPVFVWIARRKRLAEL
jgi:iron complex transport system permease protein